MTDIELTANTQPRVISSNQELEDKVSAIPDKLGFKIGEAADYVGVKQYVLRYWETEFDILKPKKSSNGQRVYTRKDIETALTIQKLLHVDRFSIEGARAVFNRLKKKGKSIGSSHSKSVRQVDVKNDQPRASVIERAIQQSENEFILKMMPQLQTLLSKVRSARKKLFDIDL